MSPLGFRRLPSVHRTVFSFLSCNDSLGLVAALFGRVHMLDIQSTQFSLCSIFFNRYHSFWVQAEANCVFDTMGHYSLLQRLLGLLDLTFHCYATYLWKTPNPSVILFV